MRKILFIVLAGVAVLALGVGTATAGAVITSKQIKDHTIKYKDLRKGAAKRLKGQTGAQGVQGVQGVQGKQGLPGKDGADGTNGVDGADGQDAASIGSTAHTVTLAGSFGVGITTLTAACEADESVVGGGYTSGIANKDATMVVLGDAPTSGDNGWSVRGYKVDAPNTNGVGSVPVTVYAICAA